MTKDQYLKTLQSFLRLPPETSREIIDEMDSHLSRFSAGKSFQKQFGKIEVLACSFNLLKLPSILALLSFKSTRVVSRSLSIMNVCFLIIAAVLFIILNYVSGNSTLIIGLLYFIFIFPSLIPRASARR